ncbi:MAG TPA: tRNA (adenosine(37)-N6)-threonylcarbamoyltransferase complex dimerization subunit type 1 TsaB [Planctomycetes bacterium]|nr:tRNA (adenosine(37)-N6)-threonylcarbamoyltransferase complex dimerization subunit type 1 TsaB [Fuerstiella sp.]HIK92485.1 tRNA (adenosine(37)-N6)-threonylcarbamoyltransferase complex dimerization subunit type 1 TsaB [Planctomycetota bacterium]
MLILAVDTSGFEGSIAVLDDGRILVERALVAEGGRHAQTLVLQVDRMLKSLQFAPQDIDAVAVSIGPGSFTGLRVGVVFAKTFAWANAANLVAVDTLRAVAQQTVDGISDVAVISDAQRSEVFVNEYTWDAESESFLAVGDVRIEAIETVVQQTVARGLHVTGPGLIKFADQFPAEASLADSSLWNPGAAAVAQVGRLLLTENKLADPNTLEPLYIRRSYAEEKAAKS